MNNEIKDIYKNASVATICTALFKKGLKILILGLTFKEDCSDMRNSKVFDILKKFSKYPFKLKVVDPYITEDTNIELPSIINKSIIIESDNDNNHKNDSIEVNDITIPSTQDTKSSKDEKSEKSMLSSSSLSEFFWRQVFLYILYSSRSKD